MLSWPEQYEMLLNTQERIPWQQKTPVAFFRGYAGSHRACWRCLPVCRSCLPALSTALAATMRAAAAACPERWGGSHRACGCRWPQQPNPVRLQSTAAPDPLLSLACRRRCCRLRQRAGPA